MTDQLAEEFAAHMADFVRWMPELNEERLKQFFAERLQAFSGSLMDENERLRGRWIPVSKQLPEDAVDVLGYYGAPDGDETCEVVMYNSAKKEFVPCFTLEWPGADPTHWIELPDPPEAERELEQARKEKQP